MTRNIFRSSGQKYREILTHKSLMNLLNNKIPKVEACGTTESIEKMKKTSLGNKGNSE
jgi:hypothetical protein